MKHEKLQQWISLHLGLFFSEFDNEIIAGNKLYSTESGIIRQSQRKYYNSLHQLGWLGQKKNSRFRPGLENPNGGIGVYAWIFVNEIRLDQASHWHTIVADACVIPLSQQNLVKLSPALERFTGIDRALINTPDDEIKLWKLFLPALAERCRTWKHLPTCEYLYQGIPVYMEGLEFEASPLCNCGKGKDLVTFGMRSQWKKFYSEATRIALSPLFSSSFPKACREEADVVNANIGSPFSKSPVFEASQSLTQCANSSSYTAVFANKRNIVLVHVKRVIGNSTSCTVQRFYLEVILAFSNGKGR